MLFFMRCSLSYEMLSLYEMLSFLRDAFFYMRCSLSYEMIAFMAMSVSSVGI